MSRLLFSWNRGQVDVTLHRWQRFNLASCPASLPLPQAARRANAEPAVATGFADDPFVVIDVGHASHRHHAGLKYLHEWINMATIKKRKMVVGGFLMTNLNAEDLTCTCRFDGSWTIAVPFTLRSKTPLVPEKNKWAKTFRSLEQKTL